ncbi:MAG TPA: hypothetical protein VFJ82_22665 [Longimicrobium sp.]|nr:hypothetical protein [Longimicrobium sp.]
MKWLKWMPGGSGSVRENALEERLSQPERWPGDRLAALLLACGSDRPGRARAAALELRETLGRLPASSLITVDQRVRRELAWGSSLVYDLPDWARTPAGVDHLRQRVGDDVAVWCVLSMHPSGRVREAAVRRIAEAGDGSVELPFLVLRSYDWAEPVRRIAEAAALERLTEANLPRVIDTLPLLVRTEGRVRGGALGRRAHELLRSPAARPLLRREMRRADGRTRLACFAWLAEDEGERLDVVLHALAGDDARVRRAAAQTAARLRDDEIPAVLPVLMSDSSARVRLHGVTLARRLGEGAEPVLLLAAIDENATVRLFARAELKERGRTLDAAFYRAALAQMPGSGGALAGLAETGAADDAGAMERYLFSPRVRLRVAAVQGVARLRRHDAVPELLRMLGDSAPKVSRAAAGELRALPFAAASVAALYESGTAHVRRNALRLLVRRGKWEGLVWALRACADPDPRIAEIGRGEVGRWIFRFNRSFAEPTPAQTEAVGRALLAAATAVPPHDRERLIRLLPPHVRRQVAEAVRTEAKPPSTCA